MVATTFFWLEPAKSFEIEAVEAASETYHENDDSFNITCTASGVYPEPEIKLYKVQSINDSLEAIEVQSSSTSVLSFRSMADGFYWINLSSHIEQNKTEEQTPARARLAVKRKRNIAEHYECRLSIPNSNYAEVKRLAIQDGKFFPLLSNCFAEYQRKPKCHLSICEIEVTGRKSVFGSKGGERGEFLETKLMA